MRLVFSLLVLVFCSGCSWLGSPLGPSATVPTPAPAGPISCGFTSLSDMGAKADGIFVFKSLADIAAWDATTGCGVAYPSAWAGVDFGTQRVIHTAYLICNLAGASTTKVDSVCVFSDRVEVRISGTLNDALLSPAGLDYRSDSVVVAKSSLPIHIINCINDGHTGISCITTVVP